MHKIIRETSRGKNKRTPYPIVIIVCEGAKTEPTYFENFKKRNKPLRIEIVKGAKGKSYQTLVDKAIETKEKKVSKIETECTVWCVSDVDANTNTPYSQISKNSQLHEFAKEAEKYGFRIALSNPCFEVWFLLHFTYSTSYLKNYDAVMKNLIEYLPEYEKKTDIYGKISDKQKIAINNTKKLKKFHKEQGRELEIDISFNPYTKVWELVESLLE